MEISQRLDRIDREERPPKTFVNCVLLQLALHQPQGLSRSGMCSTVSLQRLDLPPQVEVWGLGEWAESDAIACASMEFDESPRENRACPMPVQKE